MKKSITLQYKTDSADLRRMKQLISCRSKGSNKKNLNMVLVEQEGRGIIITATNGRCLRNDKFNIHATPGIYEIAEKTGYKITLRWTNEMSAYPNYRLTIPQLNKSNSYTLVGYGAKFVVWSAATLGTFIDPALVKLDPEEDIRIYIPKNSCDSGILLRNKNTLMVVMPMRIGSQWAEELGVLNRSKVLSSILEEEVAAQENVA